MKNYKKEILERLLDKYESSKSFIGANAVQQSFSIQVAKTFPEYADDSRIQEIRQINDDVNELTEQSFIEASYYKNGILRSVKLNVDKINECYGYIKRKPKKSTNGELIALLRTYASGDDIVNEFSRKQIERIEINKKPEHFKGDIREYSQLLKTLDAVTKVQQETFVRDFSVRVLGDSKSFEKIRSTVISILDVYGDYPNRESILEDLNVIKNPGHIYVKGDGVIQIGNQSIDLSTLNGDIAISSSILGSVEKICVTGNAVVTIENLTTFNKYKPQKEFVIYLGGYHNSLRREFIKRLYNQNLDTKYYHYGDIDAGGFNILLHLRRKTGVMFQPLHMDIETLQNNASLTKKLTENDIKRLKSLLGSEFNAVVDYMLKNNCKLEQEALD